MAGTWQTTTLVLTAVGVGGYFVFTHFLEMKQEPQEPPLAPSSIPYVGHAIGILRSKFNYYVQLSQQSPFPIFTMAIPGAKMYIVTTPELIQKIQKQPKILAFPPIEAKFSLQVCAPSKKAHEIVMRNVNGDEGDWGLSMDSYASMRAALTPGPELDEMNRVMIQNVAASLDDLSTTGKPVKKGLARWLRSAITIATTNAVYGPQNPYKDQSVQDAFWDFESDLVTILLGVFPSIMARKGIAGRENVVQAIEHYIQIGGHEKGSILMRNRHQTLAEHGVSINDIARYEVGGSIAILINTAPAVFWMLLHVFSYPAVLEDVRKEVGSILTRTTDKTGANVYSLDLTSVKTSCPLLTSTFQEVLRLRAMGTSVRQVMEDTVLDGQWLLKKDCIVQMPTRVIHTDASIWGADVDGFNPRRFMKDEKHKTENGKRPHAAAFRAFGGGTTLCPGRHFATNEILALVTMMVMRYDVTPTAGTWSMPETHKTKIASVVMEPDTDVEVEISQRQGFEGGRWAFSLKDSDKTFTIVAEDQAAD